MSKHRHSWAGATICQSCGLTRGREARRNANALAGRNAVAAYRAALTAKVRALPAPVSQYSWDDPPNLLHDYLTRAAVLALIEGEP